MPPIKTPHARAIIGLLRNCDKKMALKINEILRRTGVNAGTVKLSKVFSIDPDNAVNEINRR